MQALHITPGNMPPECEVLRQEVRDFLAQEMPAYSKVARAKNWTGKDQTFSRKLAERGWIGMLWPKVYGGGERTNLERYVLLEELLAAGAPVSFHWVADRQSGPLLIKYSPHVLAPQIVPRIVRGEVAFCIGMSEPDSGSDLASIRTRATKVPGGWSITGRKVWTSGANMADYMIALVRTSDRSENRHAGMSQLLIDVKQAQTQGLEIRPIQTQLGGQAFCECTFDDVFVPDDHLIGEEGQGWQQVTGELKFERSGPERFLSSTQLVLEMLDAADPGNPAQAAALGRIVAQYACLRQMSQGVALMMAEGQDPAVATSVVKDQGALLEQGMPDIAHALFADGLDPDSDLAQVLDYLALSVPSFSLRGGTREILRGIIARGLGLR
ncbi:acyl-CoA dehydrogenase [Comamonas serinivorans]|uniref:Acyl-CoA dehydrogenase n=1 Tax=Comamonas serinivorans TaxID=1082851 RepID=A0A1Y0EJ91_9BURK|nr:acyl-CoA dehydrogenase family protein [Comamonas serinivorans]ARU03491.1 acyl-CoA dehydrogenase [Comamonas serinivorans]